MSENNFRVKNGLEVGIGGTIINTLGNGNVGVGTTNPKTKLQINGVLGFGTFGNFGARTNIRIGDNTTGANLDSSSYDNIFMGIGAGNSTTTGGGNNFLGYTAGYNNTTGYGNNFLGSYAGYNNNAGYYNNFFGWYAGYNNTTGCNNNFFGSFVGRCNTTGSHNTFFGRYAGYCNTTGNDNNFFGRCAGYCNTTGNYNNFFGCSAGVNNTTGERNNFFGEDSGYYNITGCCNSFYGTFSGLLNTTGSFNNFFGLYAGRSNTTGCCNNFFGSNSGISASASYKVVLGSGNYPNYFDSPDTTKDTQFAVGVRTDANPSKYWLVGNENFNIGIGTTNPQTKLQINGVLGFGTFTGNYATRTNIRIGDNTTGANLTSGYDNIFMGIGAGNSTTTGYYNNFFGKYAGRFNTIGQTNNFLGHFAGYYNTEGEGNNFLGRSAGRNNTTGNYNNFLGDSAGRYNTTGRENNFLGSIAGYCNTTGTNNNFFGSYSGAKNTTGSYNNFFGHNSGISTSASRKIIIGGGFDYSNLFDAPDTTKDTQFAVGVRTDANPSKYWLVGNENFNVGIGTTNPQEKLDVGGTIRISGGISAGGTTGTSGQVLKSTGTGLEWGTATGGGGESYWVSTSAGIHTLSNVGIGTTNPQTKLQINGVLGFGTFDNSGTRTNIRIGDNTTGANLTSGFDNIFMGIGAGNSTTSGIYNNFFGRVAGYNNTTGNHNFFGGYRAGYCNTTGCYNNFSGGDAGYYNTTGSSNNFFGFQAGAFNTTGSNNNFFGLDAGEYNTTGTSNNFLGCRSGFCNTTGCYNNFFGRLAGFANTSGSYNNFFGLCAGRCNTTGKSNNFLGDSAGYYNTTGCYNNFLGYIAGFCNTTGGYNNFFGSFAGQNNTTGFYNNFIGRIAGGSNTTGSNNNFFGHWSGTLNTTGSNNNFFGAYSGISTSASNKIIFGRGYNLSNLFDAPDTTKDTQFAVGVRTDANPSKYWLVGNENFNVGIGTTNPTEKLHVQGTVRISGGISVGGTTGTSGQVLKSTGTGLEWGAVSGGGWSVKTTTYTASSGDQILADTSGGSWTLTLPATPTAGNIVTIADPGNWETNPLTVARNGSTIEGNADDFVMDVKAISVHFIYDGTTWEIFPTITSADRIASVNDNTSTKLYPVMVSGVGTGYTARVDTTGFVFDASKNYIGIGTNNPISPIHLFYDPDVLLGISIPVSIFETKENYSYNRYKNSSTSVFSGNDNGNFFIADTAPDSLFPLYNPFATFNSNYVTFSGGISAGGTTGTANQVLKSTGTGLEWGAAGGGGSGTFDTGITTSIYVSVTSGIGTAVAGLTTVQANNDIFRGPGIAYSFPSTAGKKYVIESIHVANVFSNELYLSGRQDYSGGSNVPIAQRVIIPYQGASELLEEPIIANPSDIIRFQALTGTGSTAAGVDGGLDAFIVYSEKTDTNYIGVGKTIGDGNGTEIFTSATYPSVVQSIRIINYSLSADVDVSVSIYRGGTVGGILTTGVRQGYLVYNLTVPQNSTIEICEKPKYLVAGDTIVGVAKTISNTTSICVSGKYIV